MTWALAGLALVLSPDASARAGVPGSGGVRIDGTLLSPERIWGAYNLEMSLRNFIHAGRKDAVDEAVLARVIERAVGAELLTREAVRRGLCLSADEESSLRRDEVARWRGEEAFARFKAMCQVEEDFLLERERRRRLIDRLAGDFSDAERLATEDALREFHRRNGRRYRQTGKMPLRYIFVPVGGAPLPGVADQILRAGLELRMGGKSFEPLVRQWSRHESAASGGVVPELGPGVPGLPFQPTALDECKYTMQQYPIDAAGLHLFFRDCRQLRPFESVQQQVREDFLREQRERWLADLQSALRAAAKIEYLEGPYPAKPTDATGAGAGPHKGPGP